MATNPQTLQYYTRLREALVLSFEDKTTIKVVAKDAGIDWGDVDPDGSARNAWDDVIRNARKQRRLRQLIEVTSTQYPLNVGLQQALEAYDPADEAIVTITVSTTGWPPLSHHEVDRIEQLDTLHQAVHQSGGRPLVAIWCGDDLARHDILKRRIKSLPLLIDGRGLNPLFKECQLGADVPGDLRRSCFQFLRMIPTEASDSLQPLLVSKDFSRHLLTLIVDLTWDGNTCQQMKDILDWCRQIGPLAEDRRFVVAIAIEIRSQQSFFSFLWSFLRRKNRATVVREAHERLETGIAKHEDVVLLPPLSDVGLNHLRAWRTEMENRHGPRGDDSLGDPRLCQIVPLREARPMQEIVAALEAVFTSTKR